MSARIILARHGNTFKPDQPTYWVGARTDLPLVEKGLEQARTLAEQLKQSQIALDSILTAPLQRTLSTAKIVANRLGLADKIKIDARLKEIDYGAWEGKNCDEINALGHAKEREAWDKGSIFPASPGFQPSEGQIVSDVGSILNERDSGTGLVISSNGILRYFARAAINSNDFPNRKVGTGSICIMERDGEGWRIIQWNQPPKILAGD